MSGFIYEEGWYHGNRYYRRDVAEPCIEIENLDDVTEERAAEARDCEPDGEVQPESLVQLPLIDAIR